MPPMKSAITLVALLLLAACESLKPNVVAVLPESNGHVGAVVVTPATGGDAIVLDKAYASVHGDKDAALTPVVLDETKVRQVFGKVLAARPLPPKSFLLYFREGSDELTAESKATLDDVFAEIGRRPTADLVLIGHTDRVGNLLDNDKLALKRAEAMRGALLGRGIPADAIILAGRGEREPLVATADGVAEARNRRVEVSVR